MTAKEKALKARVFSSKRMPQVFRHAAGLGAVVEGHHEDAEEDHGGDGADPVEVAGDDAVLGAGGAHADHFLRAEVGGDEGQAADPGRDGAAGEEEVVGGAHVALEGEADAEDKDEVEQHDEPVDEGEVHVSLFVGWEMAKSLWYWGKLYLV